jgi:long-chain acyl-CoA synthetase
MDSSIVWQDQRGSPIQGRREHAMGTIPPVAGEFTTSPFPLTPIWDSPEAIWHSSYPEGIPRGVDFTPVRVERLLESATLTFPDRAALRYFNTSWSYIELFDRVRQAAGGFRQLGVTAGDRVMLVLPNSPEFVVSWFALQSIGAEVLPVNPLYSEAELTRLGEKCEIRAALGLDIKMRPLAIAAKRLDLPLLIETSLAPYLPLHLRVPYLIGRRLAGRGPRLKATKCLEFDALYRRGRPLTSPAVDDVDRTAVLQPTGGTTGSPKVAVLSHRNLCSQVAQLHIWSGMESGKESFLSVLPFFHVYGATCAMLSPLAGGSTLLLQARFKAKDTLALMRRHKPGCALLVPLMIEELNQEMNRTGRRIEGLHFCMSGASAIRPDIAAEFQKLTGAVISEGFGLSEASPVTHSNPADGSGRSGSIGLPLPNTVVKLVDREDGTTPVPPGEVGEMIIRGPQIMQGYLDDREETARTLRNGWLYTGDLARMSDDGYFEIVGRKKDLIISGGLNVYPSEVEAVLLEHPSVAECAVAGMEDRRYGEKVCAWIVPVAGKQIDADELRGFCRGKLAGYKIPKQVETRTELPVTFLGKLRRVDLQRKAA